MTAAEGKCRLDLSLERTSSIDLFGDSRSPLADLGYQTGATRGGKDEQRFADRVQQVAYPIAKQYLEMGRTR